MEQACCGPFWHFFLLPFFRFCKKMQKMKIYYVHCPMRTFWRTSLRPVWQNNMGISKMSWEGCTSSPMVKPGWSWVCLPCTSSWGAPRVKMKFHGYKDENPSKFFFFVDPLVDLKKKRKKVGPEAMPKFLIVMWCICSVTVLRGTHWVPWCILKPDIYG